MATKTSARTTEPRSTKPRSTKTAAAHTTAGNDGATQAVPAARSVADRVAETAKDVLYVGVGAGVLAFQRAQVQRVELTKAIEQRMVEGRRQVSDLGKAATTTVGGQAAKLDDRVTDIEQRIDEVLELVQQRLPRPAGEVLGQARTAARTARHQVRELINV